MHANMPERSKGRVMRKTTARRKSNGSDKNARANALIARMTEARGYIYPEWEFAARQDPDFVETYNRIYELSLGDGRHVSAKVREFVAIALLAFRGAERAGLVAHMRRAIRLGATREELFEVLETCLVPGGAPTFHRGLSALMEVKD
jgi:alkylhydroperoxidase/carboxymuconolactone decarboxylase family protein YurZ